LGVSRQLDLYPPSGWRIIQDFAAAASSAKVYASLAGRGVAPHSEDWNREIENVLDRQRQAMAPRLWPEIPSAKYLCFYPMDHKRGQTNLASPTQADPYCHGRGW